MKVRRSKKMMENYVCPDCWRQINKCTCETYPPWKLIMIDKNIQDIIRILNEKKYTTIYCCESHFNGCSSLYVMFAMDYKLVAPDGFKFRRSNTHLHYDFTDSDLSNIDLYESIKMEKLKTLLAWAEALPVNPLAFR